VSKILIVVVLGGLLLGVFLVLQQRQSAAPATAQSTVTIAAPPPPAAPGHAAACARLSELCSSSGQPVDTGSCEKQLEDARKLAGDGNVARSEQCLVDAKTCAAAQGCITGGVGMGAMGEFLKGLGTAMSH
jgi:hypothetical protein